MKNWNNMQVDSNEATANCSAQNIARLRTARSQAAPSVLNHRRLEITWNYKVANIAVLEQCSQHGGVTGRFSNPKFSMIVWLWGHSLRSYLHIFCRILSKSGASKRGIWFWSHSLRVILAYSCWIGQVWKLARGHGRRWAFPQAQQY